MELITKRYCNVNGVWAVHDLKVLYDDEDHEMLKGHKWKITSNGYVYCSYKGETLFMHLLVAQENNKPNYVVHHVNQNKLDNRRDNLLILSSNDHAWLHGHLKRRQKCEAESEKVREDIKTKIAM